MLNLKASLKSVVGTRAARQARLQSRHLSEQPLRGLDTFIDRAPSVEVDASPIFIFSAGWRSGSTLLQRLICSDQATLIWGEPYDQCGIVQSLARLYRPITRNWPPEDYFVSGHDPTDLSTSWIANLYPSPADLREALRAMLCRLFSEPAKETGAGRWGLKEVRFGLEEAVLLHWLFPNAKFLLIHRDVEDAFRSYRHFSPAMRWYASWPDRPAFTPFAFARHRQRLLNQYPEIARRTGGMIISYEDLTQGVTDLDEIARYCDVKIDPDILNVRIQGQHGAKPISGERLSWLDRALLRAGTACEAHVGRQHGAIGRFSEGG